MTFGGGITMAIGIGFRPVAIGPASLEGAGHPRQTREAMRASTAAGIEGLVDAISGTSSGQAAIACVTALKPEPPSRFVNTERQARCGMVEPQPAPYRPPRATRSISVAHQALDHRRKVVV